MTMTDECWTPEHGGLQQIIQLLSESHSFDNEIQRSVQKVFARRSTVFLGSFEEFKKNY